MGHQYVDVLPFYACVQRNVCSISYDTGRSGITVVRHHVDANGKAEAMSLAESMTGADGTFYVDKDNRCIHIFASKFSTYAIGYT